MGSLLKRRDRPNLPRVEGCRDFKLMGRGLFAEVVVDKDTHMVKVRRVVATYDIGTLLNYKTGLNQLMGGITWGVSFALYEQAHIDPIYGRVVNKSLAEYHVPVNADIGTMDVTVLNIPDVKFNPVGSRGIGEIGITGSAAAVCQCNLQRNGQEDQGVSDYARQNHEGLTTQFSIQCLALNAQPHRVSELSGVISKSGRITARLSRRTLIG